ncbi:11849_t:CDS:2 [Acaulospora morrowiae]|uniref:11849_t:CDS:1 n=1 Tax=Acaulospora morrowiae TaxID=94023 RepID=A0A9N8W2Z2_9GLOM|nr:11849_t:CDS:2 [Acaulospora morrowiae]
MTLAKQTTTNMQDHKAGHTTTNVQDHKADYMQEARRSCVSFGLWETSILHLPIMIKKQESQNRLCRELDPGHSISQAIIYR